MVIPPQQKYPGVSPYVYCAGNPVKYVDPDGREFDETSEGMAKDIEANIDSKINEIQSKKYLSKDDKARVSELQKSKQDIADMRENKGVLFSYKSSNDESNSAGKGNPTTDGVDTDHVTMYVEDNMGSKLHEGRHGGDVARGELTNDNYRVGHEISAYRAQYSWNGNFNYTPFVDFDDKNNLLQLTFEGINSFKKSVNNINKITPDLVKSLVDNPGLNQKFIYPQFR